VKILFFSHQAQFIYGGEVVTLAFLRELRRLGVETHFASPAGPYAELAKEHAEFHEVPSVQFSRQIMLLPDIAVALVATHQALKKIVAKNGIQLVHATSLKAMAYTWKLGGQLPVLWHHHDILPAGRANSLWVKGLAAHAARILCPSEATRRSLLLAGVPEAKAATLRNGFRVNEWKARPPQHGHLFRVGLVGEISKRKGTDRLERVLAELGPVKDFQFLIIGEGLSEPAFAHDLKARLASRQVRFLGRRERMKELYQEMDVLLVPSRQDPLPTVIVEAGLSGVPVVGARAGGIPEMISNGKNGFLFDTEAEAAASLRQVKENWRALSLGARELAVKRYDIEALTQELLAHYREATRGA
jgi:glycosyltransferase involved in cell wall biosynthesis